MQGLPGCTLGQGGGLPETHGHGCLAYAEPNSTCGGLLGSEEPHALGVFVHLTNGC